MDGGVVGWNRITKEYSSLAAKFDRLQRICFDSLEKVTLWFRLFGYLSQLVVLIFEMTRPCLLISANGSLYDNFSVLKGERGAKGKLDRVIYLGGSQHNGTIGTFLAIMGNRVISQR